ncbi:MAG TPA: molecular chaperone TorD family protein, partial [Thermodesulfobacteriota bacterium]|nr:molecular chaperone TorD family protein [Thermodesulfobacteriota bacterium]
MSDKLSEELPVLHLLRQVFLTEPTKELLTGIGNMESPGGEGESAGMELLIASVRENETRLDEWKEDLAVEFARLFLGPGHPPAIPFASYYLSETRRLMTQETLDVRRRYLEASLAAKDLHR